MNSVVSDLKKELEKSIEQKSDLLLDNTECLYLKEYIDELEDNWKKLKSFLINERDTTINKMNEIEKGGENDEL